ncbi:MAG: hypothetical protein AAFN18_16555 [Cyanobacteria bacterium J06554_6]
MTTEFIAELSKALPGALLGLIPLGLTALFGWLEDRDAKSKRESAIAIAHRRVEFLNDWVRAHKTCRSETLAQVKADAATELMQLKQELQETFNALDDRSKQRTDHRSAQASKRTWIQKLLLAYFPSGGAAWMLHVVYYMLLGLSTLFLFFCAYTFIQDADGFWMDLGTFLILTVFVAIPLMCIRWLAVSADRRARRQKQYNTLFGQSLERA